MISHVYFQFKAITAKLQWPNLVLHLNFSMDKSECSYNISLSSHCGTWGRPFECVTLLYTTSSRQFSHHTIFLFFPLDWSPDSCHLEQIDCFQITYEIEELKLPFFFLAFLFISYTKVLQNIFCNVHENLICSCCDLKLDLCSCQTTITISIISSGTVLLFT